MSSKVGRLLAHAAELERQSRGESLYTSRSLSGKAAGIRHAIAELGLNGPHWIFGNASSNGRPVPVCSKCGWAVNGELEEHENKCWDL